MNALKDKNPGYVGHRMSKHANYAHQRGQFPVSAVNSSMLKNNGFEYSVSFFQWLCRQQYIIPIAWHHTGVASTMTAFYSISTITYVSQKYNLPLLYQIYLGKITKEEAKKTLGIMYIKAKVIPSVLGFKISSPLTLDLVRCGDWYYYSKDKKFQLNENQIEILQSWDEIPRKGWFNKQGAGIVKMLLCKRQEYI